MNWQDSDFSVSTRNMLLHLVLPSDLEQSGLVSGFRSLLPSKRTNCLSWQLILGICLFGHGCLSPDGWHSTYRHVSGLPQENLSKADNKDGHMSLDREGASTFNTNERFMACSCALVAQPECRRSTKGLAVLRYNKRRHDMAPGLYENRAFDPGAQGGGMPKNVLSAGKCPLWPYDLIS